MSNILETDFRILSAAAVGCALVPLVYCLQSRTNSSVLSTLRCIVTGAPSDKKLSGFPIQTSSKDQADWDTLDFTTTQPVKDDFSWQHEPEKPYRPWSDGPYFVTMGLKKSTLDEWVEIDKTYLSRYQYKQYLFANYPEDTMQSLPGSFDASLEALWYLADFLPQKYPTMFRRTIPNGIENLVTGDKWDLLEDADTWTTHHPLKVMSLLTTEDWFVLQTDDDQKTTRLKAGAMCFPAGWKLRERIGNSLWQIHAGKVPQYQEKLAVGMDRFFLRLRADKQHIRFNYAIDISSELFHINSHHNLTKEGLDEPVTLDQLHLRVERQYLQRLPKTRGVVFSIRTYVTPITEVTKDLDVARALRTSVSSYGPDLARYKNKHLWEETLMEHLNDILPNEGIEEQHRDGSAS